MVWRPCSQSGESARLWRPDDRRNCRPEAGWRRSVRWVDFDISPLRSSCSILVMLHCIHRQREDLHHRLQIWCIGSTFALLWTFGGGGFEGWLRRSII